MNIHTTALQMMDTIERDLDLVVNGIKQAKDNTVIDMLAAAQRVESAINELACVHNASDYDTPFHVQCAINTLQVSCDDTLNAISKTLEQRAEVIELNAIDGHTVTRR